MRFRLAHLCLAALPLSGCLPQRFVVPDPPTGPGLHVLFIGNSLTYVNDLPGLVEALADSAHQPLLETRMVAKPDYSLEDHWTDGDAMTAIRKGGWSVVVLQQGPSSVEQNRQLLIEYARRFAEPIRAVGGRPAMYSVWPTADRMVDFDRAIESYRLAAQTVDGLFFPVGDAWGAAWKRDAALPLYAFDGLHPSAEGSYLAALVMYATLYDASPVGLPSRLRLRTGALFGVSANVATILQAAAADVVGRGAVSPARTSPNAQRPPVDAGGDGGVQKPGAPFAWSASSRPKNAELNTTRKVPVGCPRHWG